MADTRYGILLLTLWLPGLATPGEDLPDPMQPTPLRAAPAAAQTGDSTPSWRLQSLLVSPTRRIAIVNGHSLRVGDHIGEARVAAIQPRKVTLVYRGNRIELRLPVTAVKKVHR